MEGNILRLSIGYTLVDITRTNDVGADNTEQRNQQRNWETLVQVAGLRAQLIHLSNPEVMELDVSRSRFGSDFSGKHKVWIFRFGVEQDAVFSNDRSSHGTLADDFTNIPIITGLTETVNLNVATFVPIGPQCNIYFDTFKL